MRRAFERGFDVALADAEFADQVGTIFVVQHRGAGLECRFGIDDRGQRLEIDADEFGCVLGQITALGQNDGDRLPDMAHLVVGQ